MTEPVPPWFNSRQWYNSTECPPNTTCLVVASGTHELMKKDQWGAFCLLSGCGIIDFTAETQKKSSFPFATVWLWDLGHLTTSVGEVSQVLWPFNPEPLFLQETKFNLYSQPCFQLVPKVLALSHLPPVTSSSLVTEAPCTSLPLWTFSPSAPLNSINSVFWELLQNPTPLFIQLLFWTSHPITCCLWGHASLQPS